MKNLFILDGLAGTGKSDWLDYIDDKSVSFNASIIRKYTTRPQREREKSGELKSDLNFVSDEQFDDIQSSIGEQFVTYKYGGKKEKYRYGFSLNEIENQLTECKNVFIIIRDISVIKLLMTKYANMYNLIPVFVYTDTLLVTKRLERDGYSREEIEKRLERNMRVWEDYATQSVHIYKHTLINNSDKTDFHRLIRQLLEMYNQRQSGVFRLHNGQQIKLGNSLSGHSEKLNDFVKKYGYEKNIFLMIKYRDSNELLRYSIETWIRAKGYNCIIANQSDITHDVYNPIALSYVCQYGIAVFDEEESNNAYSPNVSYELGSMQSQFKQCLIVKHISLKKYNFFDILKDVGREYNLQTELRQIIQEWLDGLK